MSDATVNDELEFESLPQETQDLVWRLFEAGYFGDEDYKCEKCEDLEDEIDDLEFEITNLKEKIEELEEEIEELESEDE